jgi:hypothetical protein
LDHSGIELAIACAAHSANSRLIVAANDTAPNRFSLREVAQRSGALFAASPRFVVSLTGLCRVRGPNSSQNDNLSGNAEYIARQDLCGAANRSAALCVRVSQH